MSLGLGPVEELAPGLQAVALQQGELVLLGPDGQPWPAVTRVSSGWYYTELGHHRLTLAVAQLQSDKAAAEARSSALEYALSTRASPGSAAGLFEVVALSLAVLTFAAGVVVGRLVLPGKK